MPSGVRPIVYTLLLPDPGFLPAEHRQSTAISHMLSAPHCGKKRLPTRIQDIKSSIASLIHSLLQNKTRTTVGCLWPLGSGEYGGDSTRVYKLSPRPKQRADASHFPYVCQARIDGSSIFSPRHIKQAWTFEGPRAAVPWR